MTLLDTLADRVRAALGLRSPAQVAREQLDEWARQWIAGTAAGIEEAQALMAAGLPVPPMSDETFAYLAGVAHRSFPFLYLDELDEDDDELGVDPDEDAFAREHQDGPR